MIGISVATALAGGTAALLRSTAQQHRMMTLVNTLDQIENPIRRILNIDEDRFLLENTMLAADAGLVGLPASMSSLRDCYKAPTAASCAIGQTDFVLMSGRGGYNAGTAAVQRFSPLAGPRSGAWQVYYSTSGLKCVTSSSTSCSTDQFPIQALASISVAWNAALSVGQATISYCLVDRNDSITGIGLPVGLNSAGMPSCVPFSTVGTGPRLRPSTSHYTPVPILLNFSNDCAAGQGVTSVSTRGEVVCGDIINRTTDAGGNPTGLVCPQGQDFVGFKRDGSADCRVDYSFVRDPCPAGQVLLGFNTDGSRVCNNRVDFAGTADYAVNAGTADYANSASTANYANSAGTADYADSAGTANYANSAGEAYRADGLTSTLRHYWFEDRTSGDMTNQIYGYDLCWLVNCESYGGPEEDFDCQLTRTGDRHWQRYIRSAVVAIHCVGWTD